LVLALVGLKMLTADYHPVSTPVTLIVVAGVLGISVLASVAYPGKTKEIVD
jgi:hypothetical protein